MDQRSEDPLGVGKGTDSRAVARQGKERRGQARRGGQANGRKSLRDCLPHAEANMRERRTSEAIWRVKWRTHSWSTGLRCGQSRSHGSMAFGPPHEGRS